MSCNRRPFTILELLIVTLLITLAFGGLALKIPKALENERFEKGVAQIIDKLTLAQEVMLDFGVDLEVVFAKRGKKTFCTTTCATPLAEHIRKALSPQAPLVGIEGITFSTRRLQFDGTSFATPKGHMTICGKHKTTTLTLRGYPSRILRGKKTLVNEEKKPYPETFLSAA